MAAESIPLSKEGSDYFPDEWSGSIKKAVERELLAAQPRPVEPAGPPKFSQVSHVQDGIQFDDIIDSAELDQEIREFAERLAEMKTLGPAD